MESIGMVPTKLEGWRHHRFFLLVTLAIGHAVVHWFQQSFFVILPEIKLALGLTAVQAGSLQTVRSVAGGLVNFPVGFLTDLLITRWPLLLAASVVWISVAYLLVGVVGLPSVVENLGLATSFLLMMGAMGLVGMGGAIWHPPAISALSQRFSERRGFAVSIHGVGGSTGDTVAGLTVGAMLLVFAWYDLLRVAVIPALLMALLVYLALRGFRGEERDSVTPRGYLGLVGGVIGNKALMGLAVAGGIRGMGQAALLTFLPIYMREDLAYSTALVGLYITLLTLLGLASQPVMGFLSDRYGRKIVLAPALGVLGLLMLALILVGNSGVGIGIVVSGIGVFLYALQALLLASAMDHAGDASGTTVALMFGGTFLLTAPSPLIGGALVDAFGIQAVFLYSGVLILLAALLVTFLPLRRPESRNDFQPPTTLGTAQG